MRDNKLRLTPKMVIKRGHYLYFLYYWIYGWFMDCKIAKKSLNKTIFNNDSAAFPVQSISYPYIKELIKNIEYNDNDVFVDVGCAWGRLIGYLRNHTNINKFIGVELNEKVARQASKIFNNDKNITIINGNILFNIPKEGTIFYLFNPFDASVLDAFLNEVEKIIDHDIRVLYLYPEYKDVFRNRKFWYLSSIKNLKPKYMGILKLYEYIYLPYK